MKKLKILLIGQPNVGKSSLLNALVGPKVEVSNYPGTTVEVTKAERIFNGMQVEFEDTPGIYSISDRSEEERITERALFEEGADGVIVIADSTSLERSLYMALQVLEAKVPAIIALNFVEDAKKRGIKIDYEKLGRILGIQVVSINPLNKKGIDKIIDRVVKIKETPEEAFTIKYADHIEEALNKIAAQLKENPLPRRFLALRVLEGDKDFYGYLKDTRIIEKIKRDLVEHPRVTEDISITRYGTAAFIAERVTQIIPLERISESRGERIDRILLDKNWGPFLTILIFIAIFVVLLLLGTRIQGILMSFTESALSVIHLEGGIVNTFIKAGLSGLMAGVSIALPYVFLFYLLVGLLEDVGLLSRFVVNLERFSKRLNLPGKALIPLALGLGCTAPAIRGTRILSNKREQFYASSFFTSVPCSSRIAIIMGVVGYFGGVLLVLAVFATLFVSFLIWGFLAKKLTKKEKEPLLLELPPYRKPLVKNILAKSWIRMQDFVYIVIPFLIIGGIAYAALNEFGATRFIIEPLSLITAWMGLPPTTIIPIVFGFLQKDLTGAMLISVLGTEISSVLTPLQIYTFGVATTIQIPCIIALGVLIKEFGFKRAISLTIVSIIYGLLFTGLVWRIGSIF